MYPLEEPDDWGACLTIIRVSIQFNICPTTSIMIAYSKEIIPVNSLETGQSTDSGLCTNVSSSGGSRSSHISSLYGSITKNTKMSSFFFTQYILGWMRSKMTKINASRKGKKGVLQKA
jgi:hypothetical protein